MFGLFIMADNDAKRQPSLAHGTETAVLPAPIADVEMASMNLKLQNDVDPYLVAFEEPFDKDNPK